MKGLFLLVAFFLLAVGPIQEAVAQTQVIYGHPGFDDGYEVTPMQDGGFMVGGHTNLNGTEDYWAVRFSNQGHVLWDSAYGTPDNDFLWSVQPTRSGGALLAGYSGIQHSGTESALLYAIDSVGHTIKSIDVSGIRAVHAHWFAQRKEGGYFWAGHTDSEADSTGEMILQRLDDNYNKLWQRTYTLKSAEHAHCGTLTSDGGCVLLGHTSINGYEHFWATRIDSIGNQMWSKVFISSNTMYDSPYGVVATKEGGFAFFGGSQNAQGTISSMWLVVVDSAGNRRFDNHYGTAAFAYSGIQSTDGSFMLIGYTKYQTHGGYDMDVVRADPSGHMSWQKHYGTRSNDFGYGVCQHNNQFVLVGGTDSTADGYSDLYVVYIDSNGTQIPYDGRLASDPRFSFTLDSSRIHYTSSNDNHAHGMITNLTSDSLYLTFKRTGTLPKTWYFHAEFGTQEFIADSVSTPIGFGPNESKMFLLHAIAADTPDTGLVCIRLRALKASPGDTTEVCVKFVPDGTSSVEAAQAVNDVSISPNPFDIGTRIQPTLHFSSNESISLASYDALGRELTGWTSQVRMGSGSHVINLEPLLGSHISAGVYFIRYHLGSKFGTSKLVVH